LPQMVTVSDKKKDNVRSRDQHAKTRMKQYADQRRKARNTEIQVGDTVLLRQKFSKFATNFDPSLFSVTRKKGTMIKALRNEKYVTRNASLFRKVNLRPSQWEEEDSDDDKSAMTTLIGRKTKGKIICRTMLEMRIQ